MAIPEALNLSYLETQYQKYKADPQSVDQQWRSFFKGFEIGLDRSGTVAEKPAENMDARIAEMIHRYRDLGHLLACMDPLIACPTTHPFLEPDALGLAAVPPDAVFATPQFSFRGQATFKEIVSLLKKTYCRSMGVEYMHLQDPSERRWLQDRMEPEGNTPVFSSAIKKHFLTKLTASAMFEQFLNKKYVAVTRFSLEGGDGIIPMLDTLMRRVAAAGGREIVMGMAHRGRLNVQANILGKPMREIMAEFENCYDSNQLVGAGDVKYHNGYMADIDLGDDGMVQALLVNNPSHLEAVNPVVEGIARARQEMAGDGGWKKVVPLLLHGDAAFAGQGLVAETLNMSQLEGYGAGGTVHVVINNQIGYTTLPEDARSTRYSTDVAKMLMIPVFHIHGENPEALAHAAQLAVDYRYAFGKDVVLDVVCYRRFGHNEGDEPYFTQPLMYDRIRDRPSAHKLYADQLIAQGVVDAGTAAGMEAAYLEKMEAAHAEVHGGACLFPQPRYYGIWDSYTGRYSHDQVETAVPVGELTAAARRLNTLPDDFSPHNKIKLLLRRRLECVVKNEGIDWANAESLAFAALLAEGAPIRLSGQDSGRGTFSQRHSVLYDRKTGRTHAPLNVFAGKKAQFRVYNSLLAEAGVLGFEYGYAVTQPEGLVLWEAQFGDFANNAQAVIDLFIAGGEAKWQRLCGLVLLLPHGWEGLGPEHSSARLERFLQLCADDNMQVCEPSTPAQYFHLLRRQGRARYRKPLVVMTPKSLLRHARAVSTLEDLSQGTFQFVIDDPVRPLKARRVLICSGKIYYQLLQRREELNTEEVAVIRLEQFYPFPREQLQTVLAAYHKVESWVWVQEAPENMGAWRFVQPHIAPLVGKLDYVGRAASASPATGFPNLYKKQQALISDQAVGPSASGGGIAG